jgi:hypothetical protein
MLFIMEGIFCIAFAIGPGRGVAVAAGVSVVGSSAFNGVAANAQRDTKAAKIANRFMIISLRGCPCSFWRFVSEPAVTAITKCHFLTDRRAVRLRAPDVPSAS